MHAPPRELDEAEDCEEEAAAETELDPAVEDIPVSADAEPEEPEPETESVTDAPPEVRPARIESSSADCEASNEGKEYSAVVSAETESN